MVFYFVGLYEPQQLLWFETASRRLRDQNVNESIGKKVLRGTVIITLIGIIAKLFSFLSETVLAAYLGTTFQSDAYYMVSSIKDVIYPMLSVGIWKVFMPVYKDRITFNNIREANELASKSITLFTAASLGAVGLIVLFAGPIVSVVAPGFEGETRQVCIELVRLSAPMYVLITASTVYAAMLQCHNKFLGSQIREVASHIPTILASILFYKTLGIEAMAVALVIGGAVRLLVELPFVDWGYRYRPDFRFRTPEFRQMLRHLPAALLMEGAVLLNTLIDKAMASMLPVGTISGLNYGHKLVNVFSGLLSTAISTALYPQMIELITLKKKKELNSMVTKILNIYALLMIPITLACVLLRRELVSAVFEHGEFGEGSTILTSGVFAFYSLGIFFIACNGVLNNVFYGHGDTRVPMFISISALGLNVALNLTLIHFMGVNGLALATSVSSVVTFTVRLIVLRKYLSLDKKEMLMTSAKVLAASAIACGTLWLLLQFLNLNPYISLILAAVIGIPLYLAVVKLFRIREYTDLKNLLLRRKKKTI